MKTFHFPSTAQEVLRPRIRVISFTTKLLLTIILVSTLSSFLPLQYSQHFSSFVPYLSFPLPTLSPTLFPFETATPFTLSQHDSIRQHQIAAVNKLLVSSYTTWHNSQRAIAEEAYRKGRQHKVRTLIVLTDVSITHGLGDRLRGILHAYICAVISKRVLLVSWNEPIPLSILFRNSLSANFTHDESVFAPSIFPDGATDTKTITGNYFHNWNMEKDSTQTLYLDSVPDPTVRDWFHAPLARKNIVLRELSKIGELQPYEVFPLIFKALFSSTDALRKNLRQSTKRLGMQSLVSTRKYISIHARLGLGTNELNKAGKRFNLASKGLSEESMAECFAEEAMKVAKRRGLDESPVFYIATDTPDFRRLLQRALKSKMKNGYVFSGDWDVKHIRELNSEDGKDIIKYMNTFLDIFLLAKADAIVYLKSGFANLAIWMGGIEDQTLIKHEQCLKYQITAESIPSNETGQLAGRYLDSRTDR